MKSAASWPAKASRVNRLQKRWPSAPRSVPRSGCAPSGTAPAGGAWAALAQCESGGNWHINTGNGYYGGTPVQHPELARRRRRRIRPGCQRSYSRAADRCRRKPARQRWMGPLAFLLPQAGTALGPPTGSIRHPGGKSRPQRPAFPCLPKKESQPTGPGFSASASASARTCPERSAAPAMRNSDSLSCKPVRCGFQSGPVTPRLRPSCRATSAAVWGDNAPRSAHTSESRSTARE